ncbi:MAG: hypothetical protein NTV98_00130, partial [Candidatus Roizmanbacteria bacterium]|nr:hypothetical protein [Candidatus Roizmanbacteria bacterium]
AIQSQYTELLQAIDANGSPLLKGLFIEQAREKVLEALKKSKYVDLRDLYHTLIVDVDEEGVRKMYARKFADVKPEKYIEEATKELELIVGRMNDETYGLLGESNLRISADIVEETKQLIDAVKQLSPQLGTAFARAAESLLTKIDTTTVAQIAGGIATLYETIQSEFKASRALDSVISMVVDSPISVVVGEEQETARQVREEQELKPMREFWSGEDGKGGVLAVIADKRHGIGGSHANVAEKEIEYIDAVISQLSRHTAEHQRRFIKAGIDALIPAIRSGNANATLAEKLISIFKTLTESENLKDGRSQLYESWVQEPELVNELIGTMNHDVVGYGRKFNVYAELKTLFTGFINHTNLEKVADADSGTRKYNVFAAVEKQLLDAVRTVPDVKLQAELAGLYKTMSDGIGVAAMEHLALGKLMDEANTKIKALPVVSEETTDEQRQRTIEAAQSVWDSVWNNYYDIAYGERTIQGAPGSFLSTIKSNIDNFQRSLSKADDIYSVSFLESAVTSGFNFIRKSKANFDIRQRIAFDMLSLLGNSESILVKSLSDRERPRAGESRGAKRVRTLGSVQTHFIRGIVADPDLFGAFTQYIETGPAKGTRKNSGELLLCLEMLMTAKDSRLRRKSGTSAGTAIFGVLEENGINVGTSPELADFQKFEASLIASLESATRSLEATIPEYNTFYEILSAMGTFSPHMLVRLSYAIDELRPLKDTRKMSKASQEAIAKIQGMGLSPQETAYLIYTTTGKIDFGGDFAENFGADVTKIIRKGTNPEGEDNLLNLILTFRDDVCQVVDQPPGLQMYFGRDWDKGMAPHLNRAFDKYLVGFDKRIRSAIMNAPGEANEARRNIIATELLGASMIFEQFAGDSVRAKKGPHERFIQIISDIMVDSMREPGKRRYAAEVRTVADHILKNSLPNWNKELVKDFFDRMVQKINNTEYGTWIESDQWRQMCNKIVVMESDRVPTHKDHVRMTDMTGTELKGWRRDELAEIAAEATLSLLNGYTTISGPTGLRLVANVVTGKRTPEMGELTLQEVPVKDNFIMQAIRVVGWYGTPEQKEKLVPTLEKLGREDMLFVTQSAAMLPPEDIAEFINESEHVAIAMGQTITDITTQYMIALDSVTGGVKPVLQVDLDGNVVIADGVLPADSELAQVMKTHEKTLAGKVVRESGYTAAKAKADAVVAKLSTPEALENMSGTELMDSIIAYSIASTGTLIF